MKVKDQAKEMRIKEVTKKLVAQEGMAGVKISKVAKEAGLSPSMIYTYFRNKEELVESIFWEVAKKIFSRLEDKRDTNLPFKLQFRRSFKDMIELKLSKSLEFEYFSSFVKSPFFKAEYHQMILDNSKGLIELINEGRKDLIIKDDVPVDLILALGGGFVEKLIEFHHNGILELDETIINKAFDIFWDGIKQ